MRKNVRNEIFLCREWRNVEKLTREQKCQKVGLKMSERKYSRFFFRDYENVRKLTRVQKSQKVGLNMSELKYSRFFVS